VRGVALELERIAMHLVGADGAGHRHRLPAGRRHLRPLRTAIINATMRVCGSRFGRGWLRPGGVRHAIDDAPVATCSTRWPRSRAISPRSTR
jgi:Ni,Fe-hydrogenase III large subunit